MKVQVRFRYNKETGETEIFDIDDVASTLTSEAHNREHDRIAAELGNIIQRYPRILEVMATASQEVTETPASESSVVSRQADREGR